MLNHLGLSGDDIVITDGTAVKTCRTNQARFLRNTAKQATFSNPFISAVPIIDSGNTDGYQWIRMPYLDCDNAMLWLSQASDRSIALFIERLTNYLTHAFATSKIGAFDHQAWQGKIDALLGKIEEPAIVSILEELRATSFEKGLYYGDYHGDLTLANLLISNDETSITIDAIDFLDCFIHSPIHDLVKLRQDTKHLWTLQLLEDGQYDNKVRATLAYIDSQIVSIIESDEILMDCYLPLQVLNLIRILPYNHDPDIKAYLQDEIARLRTNTCTPATVGGG